MRKYFKDKDNFECIIKSHFPNAKSYNLIQTGWTNYVFKVKNNNQEYFFRFPRNTFFANALIKETQFLKFISSKVTVKVPHLKLFYKNKRPYSIHKSIKGESLSDCYNNLTHQQKEILAKDIINFLQELESIDLNKYNNIKFQKVSDFLDNLSKVSKNNYDITMHNYLKQLENQNLCISHGDFNPGNLILKNGKLVAVIDFAFAGVSHKLTDISRILGRTPKDFEKYILQEFKQKNYKIDKKQLKKLNFLWQYVEEQYIKYIKQNHPTIKLPTLV